MTTSRSRLERIEEEYRRIVLVKNAIQNGAEQKLRDLYKEVVFEAMDFGWKVECISTCEADYTDYVIFPYCTDKPQIITRYFDTRTNPLGDFDYMIEHPNVTFDGRGATLDLVREIEMDGVILQAGVSMQAKYTVDAMTTLRQIGKIVDEPTGAVVIEPVLLCSVF